MVTPEPLAPEPDSKDWTWTIDRPCPDCGFDPAAIERAAIPTAIREATAPWSTVLARVDVHERPAPQIWSQLEYACHVRDVCTVMADRCRLMLEQDDPAFENWDQDAAAVEDRYWEQEPMVVSEEIEAAAEDAATAYESVRDDQWDRKGLRSNESVFTVETLGTYLLHDLHHHLHDVGA
ncbi:MAG: DinB family protein [Micrococcales bacterium]|nr:DinB family protein [Micrococcales bacterium]